jgi:GTP-binding protein
MSAPRALPIVAIVGRPNVGKSTLFNRLVRRRDAIVEDTPGVTRDRHYGRVGWFDRDFIVVDTGGLDPAARDSIGTSARLQAEAAVGEADLVVFLLDGRAGVNPADAEVADVLRQSGTPVLAVVNKVDGGGQESLVHDFHGLGFDPLIGVSAAHGRSVPSLVRTVLDTLGDAAPESAGVGEGGEDGLGPLRVAVVGRPNAGKSTLVNRLCGEERSIVDAAPGTTRDAIDTPLSVRGKDYLLIDTAGIRRRPKVRARVERFSVVKAFAAVERAHVVLLLVDATTGIADQDLRIAEQVAESGKAIAILVNKWDAIQGVQGPMGPRAVEAEVKHRLKVLPYAPVLKISGRAGTRCAKILPLVNELRRNQMRRIATSTLNRLMQLWYEAHHPAVHRGKPVRFYYASQVDVAPPTFLFSVSAPAGVRPAYRRYLSNKLREKLGFEGTPIRLRFKAHREPREPGSGRSGGKGRGSRRSGRSRR